MSQNGGTPEGPIEIVIACQEKVWDGEWVPPELHCENDKAHEWVISIGGERLSTGGPVGPNGTAGSAQPAEAPAVASGATGGALTPGDGDGRVRIAGGMVVPLYVLILSLMGAAVSMTRRVPEYQRRTSMRRGDDGDGERLDRSHARERLVFQIMQVISAPLVALTAYHAFNPESRAAAVAVGFSAGFASEPILKAIRALVDKMNPAVEGR